MEIDFLGLSSSEPSGVVKKEDISSEACRDSGLNKALGTTLPKKNKALGTSWPFLDRFCEVPHLKQELLNGGPVSTANSGLIGAASTLETTEPRNAVKPYGPPQLTIFYAGTVNVYDDIPPDKVQAIMSLAGNATSKSPKASHSKCYVHRPPAGNNIGIHGVLTQPITRPCSDLSSPFSVVSLPAPHLGSGPTNMDEPKKGNTEGVTAPSKVDSPKTVGDMRSISARAKISAAIPQVPAASLARFLDKRKERLRNAAPYNLGKNSSQERAALDSSPVKLCPGPATDKDCTQ